jgi:hypothetical protein
MKDVSPFYVHSACCNAHWELVYDPVTKEAHIECEVCGKHSGSNVKVTMESVPPCACCGREN